MQLLTLLAFDSAQADRKIESVLLHNLTLQSA
jgi:hypothetical protein